MATGKAVFDEALRLPRTERAELARDLIASLDDPAEQNVEAAWLAEVEKRLREVDEGTARLEDWVTVRTRIAARLASARK